MQIKEIEKWLHTTLAKEGFVYQLGHHGGPCLKPEEPIVPIFVIDRKASQTVNVKYCGCGKFESGARGNWEQILHNGWYRAGLVHPRVCATFEVMSSEQAAIYLPE